MNKNTYQIVGFERIAASELEPHPDAQLPMDTDDQIHLSASIAERGVILPILVLAKPEKDGKRLIIDGVNRYAKLKHMHGGGYEVPCVTVECEDPREAALTCLATGRKRSTGQRIMAFLEMHRREVLKVAELTGDLDARAKRLGPAGHVTGREIPRNLQLFTCEAIAAGLGVSDKDVRLGVELLWCLEHREWHSTVHGCVEIPTRPLDMENEGDKQYYSGLKCTHAHLMSGRTPIRRWKAAAGGKTVNPDGKAEINYANLADTAMTSLITVFNNWKKMTRGERQIMADKWDRVVEAARKNQL